MYTASRDVWLRKTGSVFLQKYFGMTVILQSDDRRTWTSLFRCPSISITHLFPHNLLLPPPLLSSLTRSRVTSGKSHVQPGRAHRHIFSSCFNNAIYVLILLAFYFCQSVVLYDDDECRHCRFVLEGYICVF